MLTIHAMVHGHVTCGCGLRGRGGGRGRNENLTTSKLKRLTTHESRVTSSSDKVKDVVVHHNRESPTTQHNLTHTDDFHRASSSLGRTVEPHSSPTRLLSHQSHTRPQPHALSVSTGHGLLPSRRRQMPLASDPSTSYTQPRSLPPSGAYLGPSAISIASGHPCCPLPPHSAAALLPTGPLIIR